MSVEVTVNWQPALNVCRCCLNDCCYKDISTEYYWMGQKEVYADMLSDVFGLTISYQDIGPGSSNRLICEDCITRLRDATTFKKQVIESEKNFLLHIQKRRSQTNNVTVPDEKVDLKVECPKSEEEPESSDDGFDQDIGALDDDSDCVDVKVEQIYEVKEEEEEPVKKPPKRKTTTKAYTRRKRPKLSDTAEETNDEPSSSKKNKSRRNKARKARRSITDNSSEETPKKQNKERLAKEKRVKENTIKLILNSNVCLFRWNKFKYKCFCCDEAFGNILTMREHTNENHKIVEIEKKLLGQRKRTFHRADISYLKCKLCSKTIEDLNELQKHLTNTHGLNFYNDELLLVPYRIESDRFECQICHATFNAFASLTHHMNSHYKNHICETCGSSFANLESLLSHTKSLHKEIKCTDCGEIFPSMSQSMTHKIKVHKKTINRYCPQCPEIFPDNYKRLVHLIRVHGMEKPQFKCEICERSFITRYFLNSHIRMIHMKEKNHECETCGLKFYSLHDKKRHSRTHTGEKNFVCNICDTHFAAKDSLRRHIRRTQHTQTLHFMVN